MTLEGSFPLFGVDIPPLFYDLRTVIELPEDCRLSAIRDPVALPVDDLDDFRIGDELALLGNLKAPRQCFTETLECGAKAVSPSQQVVLAWQKELDWDLASVNVNGGAMALGHPIGATGTRLMTTLLNEMERSGGFTQRK